MGSKLDLNNSEIVFLDIETSSLYPNAEILAIGGLITDNKLNIKEKFHFLIKPKNISEANPSSLKIIDYSEEKWKNSIDLNEVLKILYPKFKNKILAGWVSHFDWSRLERAFYENGFDDPFDYRKIDIFSIAVAKYGLSNLGEKETLTKICKFLNIERGQSHSAYDDAYASYQVFLRITDQEKNFNNQVIIYTDGGFKQDNNQEKKSAIGVVIKFVDKVKEYAKIIDAKSNNEAEYSAIIFALEKIKHLLGKENISKSKIIINTDSELVGKQIKGEYKIIEENLIPFFIKINNLKIDFGKIEINIIPREENLADKLVKKVLINNFSTLI